MKGPEVKNKFGPYHPFGSPFHGVPDIRDMVMYEINIRAFSPSGDLPGVTARLDEISKLGVNVIWLLPIHPVGKRKSKNSPYSITDHKAVGAEYGTLDDLRKLTDAAHARGMAVIMDWVANHTAWDHQWINNKEWYTRDASGNILHPPGTSWEDVADLNYDNQEIRGAMIDAMSYWVLEANIDGFRYDHADGIPTDFWRDALNALNSIPDRKLIHFADGVRKDHFQTGFDLLPSRMFYLSLKDAFNGGSLADLQTVLRMETGQLPPEKQWVRYTSNHDECAWNATPVSVFQNKEGAIAASVYCIFSGGVPLIYGSQEVGIADRIPFFENTPINWSNDPEMLQAYQKVLQYYSGSEVARRGKTYNLDDANVLAILKGDGNEMALMVNARNVVVNYNVPGVIRETNWMDIMTGLAVSFGETLVFNPFQFYLLKRL